MFKLKVLLGLALVIFAFALSCTKQTSSPASTKTVKESITKPSDNATPPSWSARGHLDTTAYDTLRNTANWQAHEDGLKASVIQMGYAINSVSETWSHDSSTLIIGIHFSGTQRAGDPGEIDGPNGKMQVLCGLYAATMCGFNNFSQAGAWMSGTMIGVAWFGNNVSVGGYVYVDDNLRICARVSWANWTNCPY
jgi:hypothetical protein